MPRARRPAPSAVARVVALLRAVPKGGVVAGGSATHRLRRAKRRCGGLDGRLEGDRNRGRDADPPAGDWYPWQLTAVASHPSSPRSRGVVPRGGCGARAGADDDAGWPGRLGRAGRTWSSPRAARRPRGSVCGRAGDQGRALGLLVDKKKKKREGLSWDPQLAGLPTQVVSSPRSMARRCHHQGIALWGPRAGRPHWREGKQHVHDRPRRRRDQFAGEPAQRSGDIDAIERAHVVPIRRRGRWGGSPAACPVCVGTATCRSAKLASTQKGA